MNNSGGGTWSIGTYLRIRPLTRKSKSSIDYNIEAINVNEKCKRTIFSLDIPEDADPGLVHNNSDSGLLRYEFDNVFGVNSTQEEIFQAIARDKIHDVLQGINCTIFAYGQTSSGKTYSICGGDTFAERGIIPRTLNYMFEEIGRRKSVNPNLAFKFQVSFTEVYKETVYDLLDQEKRLLPLEQWTPVQVLEGEQGLVLRNVNVYEVTTQEEALGLFFMGTTNRITSSTSMNNASSRSHGIFTIIVESEGVIENKTVLTTGKINFVDLAGSERMYKLANTKFQITEAKSINLSLHYLEQVVVSLRGSAKSHAASVQRFGVDAGLKSGHIPYRNSVLTNMLRDSLGGNCKSSFLLTISAEGSHFEETVSTCRFGQRCGEIKVNVFANTEVGLGDQLKDLTIKLRSVERQLNMIEEQKAKCSAELEDERAKRAHQCESRSLTAEEKLTCKLCVQNLLSSAKDSLNAKRQFEANSNNNNNNSNYNNPSERKVGNVDDSQHILERSQELLFKSVEKMDKAVLVELCTALGGLLQSMYIERENNKFEDLIKQQKKATVKAEKEAKLKADTEAALQAAQAKVEDEEETRQRKDNAADKTPAEEPSELSTNAIKMMMAGATFIKHSRNKVFGSRDVRFVWLTPDLRNICWRHVGHMQSQSGAALRDFTRVEVDGISRRVKGKESCLLTLVAGRDDVKNLNIEYATFETIEENRDAAQLWAEGLTICIRRARTSSSRN